MKKIALIVAIASLVLCATLVTIGFSNRMPEPMSIQNPSYSTPILPTETAPPPPYDKLTPGNYYLIAGTNVNNYLQAHDVEYYLQNDYLRFEFKEDGNAIIWYYGNHITEYTEKNGDIVFAEPTLLLDIYPFEVEHDEDWVEQNNPEKIDTLTYDFNPETNVLSIKYGIESMELKYFPSAKDAAEWLLPYIPEGGGIEMPDYSHQYEEILSLIK